MIMTSFTTNESFTKNGFVIIEDIIDLMEVEYLRKQLYEHFQKAPCRQETINYVLQNKRIFQIQFNRKLLGKLREIVERSRASCSQCRY